MPVTYEEIYSYKLGLIEAEVLKSAHVDIMLNEILEFLGHDITTIDEIAVDAVREEKENA